MNVKDGDERYGRVLVAAAGVSVVVLVFMMYLATLSPTVLYYKRPILLDSAMLQVQAIVLGIPGGTGDSSWVMLTHLFTYLPFGDPAYRVNLASAVYAALAVLMLFVAAYLLCRRVIPAVAGALAFGLGTTFWSQAVIAEVYTLNAFLILLPIICLLLWRESRRDRYLMLASFLAAFAFTNHLTSALVVPAAFVLVGLVDWRKILDWKTALKCGGLFILGLTPFLYLPIRASMDPPLNEWDPTTPNRFWELVSGGGHQKLLFVFGPSELPGRLGLYGIHLVENLGWVLPVVGLMGAVVLFMRDRAVGAFTGFLFFGWLIHSVEYSIFDYFLYFITTYIILCLWISVGFGVLLETLGEMQQRLPALARRAVLVAVPLIILALPFFGLGKTYAENDMSDAYQGRKTLEVVAAKAEKGATILHHRSELWYLVLVEKRRQDLKIIDPWFPGRVRETDIVWPDDIDVVTTNLRYGTNDYTGVSTAKETARNGAVYILDQDSSGPQNFIDADIDIVRVEKNILYELVPPGEKRYTSVKEARD